MALQIWTLEFQGFESTAQNGSRNTSAEKQPRNAFQKFVPVKSLQILEVIYSEVCGPFQVESLGGNRYFVTFIDDLTRMTDLYNQEEK